MEIFIVLAVILIIIGFALVGGNSSNHLTGDPTTPPPAPKKNHDCQFCNTPMTFVGGYTWHCSQCRYARNFYEEKYNG